MLLSGAVGNKISSESTTKLKSPGVHSLFIYRRNVGCIYFKWIKSILSKIIISVELSSASIVPSFLSSWRTGTQHLHVCFRACVKKFGGSSSSARHLWSAQRDRNAFRGFKHDEDPKSTSNKWRATRRAVGGTVTRPPHLRGELVAQGKRSRRARKFVFTDVVVAGWLALLAC